MFKNFLHSDLCVGVDEDLEKATSIDACYLVIEQHFLELKPLFTRRLALFRMKKNGRTFKDFCADLRRKAREAELHSITPAQLMVFLALAGCRDDGPLFLKLRETRDPDLTDLTCKAALHEGMLKDSKALDVFTTNGNMMAVEITPSAEEFWRQLHLIVTAADTLIPVNSAHSATDPALHVARSVILKIFVDNAALQVAQFHEVDLEREVVVALHIII